MNNFTEWHGNIIGPEGTPYQGGIFHFVINFKDEHPKTPPTVKMLTRIEHPCVNNGFIQLDMFTELDTKRKNFHPPSTSLTRSRYWYPGYSAVSILMQLEAFLYEGTIDIALRSLSDLTEYEDKKSRWESGVRFSVEQSIHMSCNVCKHRPRKPWPAVEPIDCYKRLYDDYLENAICFYTLKTYSQAALGIGINFTKDAKSGSVQIVKCVPQVVSLSAYKSSKIREVWGESYSHWMPICEHLLVT
jgi:ubiquitin-protein ligase